MSQLLFRLFHCLWVPHNDILMLFEVEDPTSPSRQVLCRATVMPTAPLPAGALEAKPKTDPNTTEEPRARLGIPPADELFFGLHT